MKWTSDVSHFAPTPLTSLVNLSTSLDIDLIVKRDDLFPATGGGSKARKAVRLVAEAECAGCNALITTGGLQSNHARAIALAAAARGWRCVLVLHSRDSDERRLEGNLLLMHLAGAKIEIVDPDLISEALIRAKARLESQGLRPVVIPGGGHSLEGGLAFVEATRELESQSSGCSWIPDVLVLASGTGATQAGIVVGLDQLGWDTRVIGISVAREIVRGRNAVRQMCQDLRSCLDGQVKNDLVDFRDDWVGGGYEVASDSVFETMRLAAKTDGLVLDPTYTGKAFQALVDMRRRGEISAGSKVLFWHTGGLMNLMASQYYKRKDEAWQWE